MARVLVSRPKPVLLDELGRGTSHTELATLGTFSTAKGNRVIEYSNIISGR